MCGEAPDLGIQVGDLLCVGRLENACGVAPLEEAWQPLEGHRLPLAQLVRVDAMRRRDLANCLVFPQ